MSKSVLSSRWQDMNPESVRKITEAGAVAPIETPVAEDLDAKARRVLDAVDRELHEVRQRVGWKNVGVDPELEVEISDTLLLKIRFALAPETDNVPQNDEDSVR